MRARAFVCTIQPPTMGATPPPNPHSPPTNPNPNRQPQSFYVERSLSTSIHTYAQRVCVWCTYTDTYSVYYSYSTTHASNRSHIRTENPTRTSSRVRPSSRSALSSAHSEQPTHHHHRQHQRVSSRGPETSETPARGSVVRARRDSAI